MYGSGASSPDDHFADNILLEPAERVTFQRESALRQSTMLKLTNQNEKDVFFKMRSTEPKVLKMKPIYGLLSARSEANVKLYYLSNKVNTVRNRDRFTVVITAAPPNEPDAESFWKRNPGGVNITKKSLHVYYTPVVDHTGLCVCVRGITAGMGLMGPGSSLPPSVVESVPTGEALSERDIIEVSPPKPTTGALPSFKEDKEMPDTARIALKKPLEQEEGVERVLQMDPLDDSNVEDKSDKANK